MTVSQEQHGGSLSIRQELAGTLLLTGGLGFLGSVALESLLRNCPEVECIYLLVRGKRTQTAQQRVDKMMCGGLFHMLHKQVADGGANVFAKVHAVEGDLAMPGLGLSAADTQRLQAEVTHVIHSAANIELDADIQKSLSNNFFGTQGLMHLASGMKRVRAFVHVSTYFVNNHMPRNSVVREAVHALPLELNGQPVGYAEFVAALMAMPSEEANAVALALMAKHNFNSTYAFGKHLTEMMVLDTRVAPGVARAMVRPSLIAGLLGAPYPGYVTGFGGPGGYTMGYAVGFFPTVGAVAYGSDYIMDIIPCDVVAGITLAAAAKASARYGSAAADEVPIYHACSAHVNPCPLDTIFDANARFWSRNPPPMTMPGLYYPVFEQEHKPTAWGIALGRAITWTKIWAICGVLKVLGKTKEARMLNNAYTAFTVYNTPRYDRSILSAVDNGLALRDELPAAERELFTLVADSSVLEWYAYGYGVFAGVQHLLFRKPGTSTSEVPHSFVLHPAAESTAVLRRDGDAKLPAAAAADDSGELVPTSSEGSADFEARLAVQDEDVLPSDRKAAHHKDQQAATGAAAKPAAAPGARPDAAMVDA